MQVNIFQEYFVQKFSQVPVAHIFNPTYSERQRSEGLHEVGSQPKKIVCEVLFQNHSTLKRASGVEWLKC
jgi:hypothetical protein